MARETLPPYISKDTADSILFIGKAMRVLKQSSGSCREPGIPHCCNMHHLADIHLQSHGSLLNHSVARRLTSCLMTISITDSQVPGMRMRRKAFMQTYARTGLQMVMQTLRTMRY